MLSQDYEQETYEEAPRNISYRPTDIFNLAPEQASAGKRRVVDRNRSSVFGGNDASPALASPARKDYMASDIFFGGNQPDNLRFGAYNPSSGSSRRSSAKNFEDLSVSDLDKRIEQHNSQIPDQHEAYSRSQDYGMSDAQVAYVENKAQRSVSNVFDAAQQEYVMKGSRRHYTGGQQSSDIFFQSNDAPVNLRRSVAVDNDSVPQSKWVPSVKLVGPGTSYSNIFGGSAEIDQQVSASNPRKGAKKEFSHAEKLSQVSGLSSENLNRDRKVGRRGVGQRSSQQQSQIWF